MTRPSNNLRGKKCTRTKSAIKSSYINFRPDQNDQIFNNFQDFNPLMPVLFFELLIIYKKKVKDYNIYLTASVFFM